MIIFGELFNSHASSDLVNVHQLERISYYPSYFQNQTKYPSHTYEGRLYHMKIT